MQLTCLRQCVKIMEEQLINQIKEAYKLGLTYFEGEINSEPFKIRMNKNHGWNYKRNCDNAIHNLSLVNVRNHTLPSYAKVNGKVRQQEHDIKDWKDAEEAINSFFYNIENYF